MLKLRDESNQTRSQMSDEINQLRRDIAICRDNEERSMKTADQATNDSKIIATQKDDLAKENRCLRKEIELLEEEVKKSIGRSKEMKGRLKKMDKIVYGHQKTKNA